MPHQARPGAERLSRRDISLQRGGDSPAGASPPSAASVATVATVAAIAAAITAVAATTATAAALAFAVATATTTPTVAVPTVCDAQSRGGRAESKVSEVTAEPGVVGGRRAR